MAYGPIPPPYGVPVAARPRPKARGSIVLPLLGLALVVLCVFVLPWAHVGSTYVTLPKLWTDTSDPMATLPPYVTVGWLGLFGPAVFISFAGTLDSIVWRVLTAVAGGLIGAFVIVVGLVAGAVLASMAGTDNHTARSGAGLSIGVSVAIGLAIVCFWVGYALLRRVALRVVSGLLLLGFAAVHVAMVSHDFTGHAGPGAYVAAFGYFLCALGAFIGPRYVYPYAGPVLSPPAYY